jgi:hypothetical protein
MSLREYLAIIDETEKQIIASDELKSRLRKANVDQDPMSLLEVVQDAQLLALKALCWAKGSAALLQMVGRMYMAEPEVISALDRLHRTTQAFLV